MALYFAPSKSKIVPLETPVLCTSFTILQRTCLRSADSIRILPAVGRRKCAVFGVEAMMALVARVGYRRRLLYVLTLCTALNPAILTTPSAVAADAVVVILDQAKVMRIPERATTVVVGNPLIADISVQTGGMIVVTGKGYGVTNLIALDRGGATLLEQMIEVQGPSDRIVVVHRGIDKESYSCTPICERRITLGDNPIYFEATLLQSGRRDTQAQGAGGNNQPSSR
jgi:Pilus formation protein N terminal region